MVVILAPSASACSMVACIDSGVEVVRDFIVRVKHEGNPGEGVEIQIKSNNGSIAFNGHTDSAGRTTIPGLPPGEYWLSAEFLGITAAYHCFHVAAKASRKAKRLMSYEWVFSRPMLGG